MQNNSYYDIWWWKYKTTNRELNFLNLMKDKYKKFTCKIMMKDTECFPLYNQEPDKDQAPVIYTCNPSYMEGWN
jgi:hypothetical protein